LGEGDVVAPVRVVVEARVAVARTTARGVGGEERRQAPVELARDLLEVHEPARSRRALDPQVVAVEVVITLERLGEEVVGWDPDRAAPVGVTAEERRVRLGRRVVHLVLVSVEAEDERMLAMYSRERADAVRGEELALVQHIAQRALQAVPRRDREQALAVV